MSKRYTFAPTISTQQTSIHFINFLFSSLFGNSLSEPLRLLPDLTLSYCLFDVDPSLSLSLRPFLSHPSDSSVCLFDRNQGSTVLDWQNHWLTKKYLCHYRIFLLTQRTGCTLLFFVKKQNDSTGPTCSHGPTIPPKF